MKRKYLYVLIIGLASVLCLVAPRMYKIHTQVHESFHVWQQFLGHIQHNKPDEAKKMLLNGAKDRYAPIETFLKFRQGHVYYDDIDITDKLAHSKCRYWPTFSFYLCEKKDYSYDKVVLDVGYILIDKGNIFYLKIP